MALEKTTTPSQLQDMGMEISLRMYWKIVELRADILEMTSFIRLNGYASKEARDAGKTQMAGMNITTKDSQYVFNLENLNVDGMNPIKYAYMKLKETEFFADAIDV